MKHLLFIFCLLTVLTSCNKEEMVTERSSLDGKYREDASRKNATIGQADGADIYGDTMKVRIGHPFDVGPDLIATLIISNIRENTTTGFEGMEKGKMFDVTFDNDSNYFISGVCHTYKNPWNQWMIQIGLTETQGEESAYRSVHYTKY